MNVLKIRKRIRPILLAIGFSAVGFAVAFVLKVYCHIPLNRFQVSIIAFVVTSASVFLLFPLVFKIPFGKVTISEFLTELGLYRQDNIFRYVVLGIIPAIITLSGMMFASSLTGKYTPTFSTITLTQAVFSLTPGIYEEILFRGVIMIVLIRMTKSLKKSALIQVILFGLVHIKGLDLLNYVDAFSVSILALSFTYLTYKTQSLIPAIVFHYLHDTFIFFVQLPEGQYEGFNDNVLFYIIFWFAIGITILVTRKISERFFIQSGHILYAVEVTDKALSAEPVPIDKKAKTLKSNKIMLLINAVGFSAILLTGFEESSLFVIIFDALFVLTNLLLFFFLRKFERDMNLLVSLLTAAMAFVTAYDYYTHDSETVYFIFILLGLANIAVGLFKNRERKPAVIR